MLDLPLPCIYGAVDMFSKRPENVASSDKSRAAPSNPTNTFTLPRLTGRRGSRYAEERTRYDETRTLLQVPANIFTLPRKQLASFRYGPPKPTGQPAGPKQSPFPVQGDASRNSRDRVQPGVVVLPSKRAVDQSAPPASSTLGSAQQNSKSAVGRIVSRVDEKEPVKMDEKQSAGNVTTAASTEIDGKSYDRTEEKKNVAVVPTTTIEADRSASGINIDQPAAISKHGPSSGGQADAGSASEPGSKKSAASQTEPLAERKCTFCEAPFKAQLCKLGAKADPSDCIICRGIQAILTHRQREADIRQGSDAMKQHQLKQTYSLAQAAHSQKEAELRGNLAKSTVDLVSAKKTISSLQQTNFALQHEVAWKTKELIATGGKYLQVQQHREELWGMEKNLQLMQKQAGDRIAQVMKEKADMREEFRQYVEFLEKGKEEKLAEQRRKYEITIAGMKDQHERESRKLREEIASKSKPE
jgi:hypothetical protein